MLNRSAGAKRREQKAPAICCPVKAVVRRSTKSIQTFDLTRSPGFIEPWLQRAVKPEDDEPAFPGNGFDPIPLFSFWCFWSEINGYRSVGVLVELVTLVV